MSDLVSVIITSYNRFKYMLNAIESVKNQTYKNIEIIVVNDRSTEPEYYNYDYIGCTVIHLDKNSKVRFGHASPGGFQRSVAMKIASGKYFAFLDDDDYWLPNKLESQIESMKRNNCMMSCTEGLFGFGEYSPSSSYKLYNKEKYFNILRGIYHRNGKGYLLENGFPEVWDDEFMNVHNCCIASSVVIEKSVVEKIGSFSNQLWAPDYEYWKRVIKHTKCAYITEPSIYYDGGHGSGQNY